MPWSVLRYVEGDGGDPVGNWLDELASKNRAAIDRRIAEMERVDVLPPKWVKSYATLAGIIELRIKGENKQLRPLATYMPGQRIVLLAGAYEIGDELNPKSAKKAAVDRRAALLKDPKRVIPYF